MKIYALQRYQNHYEASPYTVAVFSSKKALEMFVKKSVVPWYNQPARLCGGRPYGVKSAMREGGYSIREMDIMSVKDVSALPTEDPNS